MSTGCSLSMEDAKMPHATWWHHKDGLKMRTTNDGVDNMPQTFYFTGDHQLCPDGSRAWNLSSVNVGFGHRMDWTCSVRGLNVRWGNGLLLLSVIIHTARLLRNRSLTWRSSLQHEVTSVISIPNTTVSSTSLSSTGEWPSWSTGVAQRWRTLRRWDRM